MNKFKSIPSMLLMGILLFTIGCSNSKVVATEDEGMNNNENTIPNVPDLSTLDYYAFAADSSWLLTVQYGKEVTFVDKKNNIEYHSNTSEKQVAGGADIVLIFSKGDKFLIRANIGLEDCHKNGKHVNIMVKRLNDEKVFDYSSCGVYHGSPRLHDIWVLESLNGDTLTAEQFPRELPHFEFNLNTQKMSGFAGCNQVSGDLRFEYSRIIIEPIVSTRMYCKETSTIENKILEILRNKPVYNFNKLHLYIETTEGSLIFKKVD